MITGHGDMDLAIRSLKFEATDFITKPINDDALEIALKRAHERIALREQLRQYTENLGKLVGYPLGDSEADELEFLRLLPIIAFKPEG